jgi:hypothetical protein
MFLEENYFLLDALLELLLRLLSLRLELAPLDALELDL